MDQERLSLANLLDGGVIERFDDALQEVVKNIMDPNTDPKTARRIALTVTIKPRDEDRDFGDVVVDCKSTLAPAKRVITQAWFGFDGQRHVAIENNPKQGSLFQQDPRNPGKVIPIEQQGKEDAR